MKRVFFLLAVFLMACNSGSNSSAPSAIAGSGDKAFKAAQHAYVVEFLNRNPTVNTYLGGEGLDPSLRDVDGRLRDHSASALEDEDRWLASAQHNFEGIDPRTLSPALLLDREVTFGQIRFLLHQHQVRHYQQRALDTYTDEPFRAIDWQLQGMTETGDKTYGTAEEWKLVAKRLEDIPRFLSVAREQLLAGIKDKNTPDFRMLRRNGIETAEADAKYFDQTLPGLASDRIAGPQRDELVKKVREASKGAAAAYRGLRDFVAKTYFQNPASPTEGPDLCHARGSFKAHGRQVLREGFSSPLHQAGDDPGRVFPRTASASSEFSL